MKDFIELHLTSVTAARIAHFCKNKNTIKLKVD